MEGERTNLKKKTGQASIMVRKEFNQNVKPQQIKSLFSTFSQQLKAGTLKVPMKTKTQKTAE